MYMNNRMELAMGTPNSKHLEDAMRSYLLNGVMPSLDEIRSSKVDLELLEDRFRALKPQLPYLEGYKAMSTWKPFQDEFWNPLIETRGLSNARALRFETPESNNQGVHHSLFSSYRRTVEVFLLREGNWVVYINDQSEDSKVEPEMLLLDSTSEVVKWLETIATRTQTFRGSEDYVRSSVALMMMQHLSTILKTSRFAKQRRLQTQVDLQAKFDKVDLRIGLPTP
jgi:hypothetical protein